ncbi:hypothetical protein D9611_011223 [Ephemerocybe angulata]|uniref:Uncharacterized protein n=1 Tax=Ephemerocybe angulata TaxID=980116 RepID=A0A8H5FJL2_9AGAR|nr:hypothetical protein D9611_011223 [Tulosesus angulatus]
MSEDITNEALYRVLDTVHHEALDSGGVEEHRFYHLYDVVFGHLNSLPAHRTGGKVLSTAPQPTFRLPKRKAADQLIVPDGDGDFTRVKRPQRIPVISPGNRGDSLDGTAPGHSRPDSPPGGAGGVPSFSEFSAGVSEDRVEFDGPSSLEKRKRADSDTRSATSDQFVPSHLEPEFQFADISTDSEVSEMDEEEKIKMKRTPDFALFLHTVSKSTMYPVLAVECKPFLPGHYPTGTHGLLPVTAYNFFKGEYNIERVCWAINLASEQAFSQCECIFNEFKVAKIKFIFTVGPCFYAYDVTRAEIEAKEIQSLPPKPEDIKFLFAKPAPGAAIFEELNPELIAIWEDIRTY